MQTDPPSAALQETEATIADALTVGGGAAVEIGGRFVGVVLWAPQRGGLYFGRLAVLPDCRGQGIGRALVAAAEHEARRRGLPFVHLGTRLVLTGTRAFFARCGYVEAGLTTHAGYAAPTSVVMEKWFDPPGASR